jgi:hypothetical protein
VSKISYKLQFSVSYLFAIVDDTEITEINKTEEVTQTPEEIKADAAMAEGTFLWHFINIHLFLPIPLASYISLPSLF